MNALQDLFFPTMLGLAATRSGLGRREGAAVVVVVVVWVMAELGRRRVVVEAAVAVAAVISVEEAATGPSARGTVRDRSTA